MKIFNKENLLSIFAAGIIPIAYATADFDQSHTLYNEILKSHVSGGRVDYQAMKDNPRPLNRYLA